MWPRRFFFCGYRNKAARSAAVITIDPPRRAKVAQTSAGLRGSYWPGTRQDNFKCESQFTWCDWCCVVGTNFSVLISCNYQIARIFLMTLLSFFLPSDISHLVLHTRSLHRYCCAAITKICFLNSRNHPNHSYFLDHTPVFLLGTKIYFTKVPKCQS